jgi:hypothetical protein
LVRRYLDRKTKEHYKRLTRYDEDDHKYVTETGPKIPEFEETVNAKRIVYLKDSGSEPLSQDEILNEKVSELLNAASETSEYIKNVNTHLDKQKLRVDELKKLQKIFEKQILDLESKTEE